MKFLVEVDPGLRDYYVEHKVWEGADSVTKIPITLYGETYSAKEKKQQFGDKNYYELHFSNKGGLVMPIIIEWTYKDGSQEIETIPAQIWRKNEAYFSKVFVKEKIVTAIRIDPFQQTADIDRSNNNWPVKEMPSRFQVFKRHKMGKVKHPMGRKENIQSKP